MYQVVYLTRDGKLKYGASSETGSPTREHVAYSVVASWVETCGRGVFRFQAHSSDAPTRGEVLRRFYPGMAGVPGGVLDLASEFESTARHNADVRKWE